MEAPVEAQGRAGMLLRSEHVLERCLDGELVLFDPTRQRVHALNATAAFIWLRCDGRHDEARIAAELARIYRRDRDEVAVDVAELVRVLLDEGLLARTG